MHAAAHLHDGVGARALRVGASAAGAAVGIAVLHQLLDNVFVIHLNFLQMQLAAHIYVPIDGRNSARTEHQSFTV